MLYTAAGLGVWDNNLGLLARAGEDYPHEWLRSFEKRGWDTHGIHILGGALDLRYFQARLDPQTIQRANPVTYFARLGLTFPKSLLGYQAPPDTDDRKTTHPASPNPHHIPPDYLNASIAHLCPLDYVSTCRLLSTFRQANVPFQTLDPSAAYMNVNALDDVRILLQGLMAFLPSEQEAARPFLGKHR